MTTAASTFPAEQLCRSGRQSRRTFGNGVLCRLSAAVFEAAVLVCQDFPTAHSAWQRIMASLHSALRISLCKSLASLGRIGDLQNQIQIAEFMPEIAGADRLRVGCINGCWPDERRQQVEMACFWFV